MIYSTPDSIDTWFKSAHELYAQPNGRLSPEDELELSDEYKRKHQALIDARIKEQTPHPERKCEICLTDLPIRRGRAPRFCDDHKGTTKIA